MAHELEIINGQAQMFSVKETPWHNLGHIVQDAPTIAAGIKLAGLDWQVVEQALYTQDGIRVNHKAIIRETDKSVLGVVGQDYAPVQNNKAFEFFQPFIESGECTLETAGSLRGGKRIWILAKINRDPIKVKNNDIIDKYLLLSNGHDGNSAVKVGFTPIRVVCANTLAMTDLKGIANQLIRIYHTKEVNNNLDTIRETIDAANQRFEANAEVYQFLASRGVNRQDLDQFVQRVFFPHVDLTNNETSQRQKTRIANMNETIMRLFETGYGNNENNVNGTYYALYNAATQYLSYEAGRSDDTRIDSLWFGQSVNKNKKALDVALELANAA